jgi:hypothetical protein
VNDLKYTYTYDVHGNQLSGKNEAWKSSAWNPTTEGYFWINFQKSIQYLISSIYRFEATFKSFMNAVPETDHTGRCFSVYPNPASNKITITRDRDLPGETMIAIFNMKGEQVLNDCFQNQNPVEMDVSTLESGIYLLKILTRKGNEVKKLVVQ